MHFFGERVLGRREGAIPANVKQITRSNSQALLASEAFTVDSVNLQIACKVIGPTLWLRGVRLKPWCSG